MRIHVRPKTPEIPVLIAFKPWSHWASASALTLVSMLENEYDADTLYWLYRYKFMWAITEQITYAVTARNEVGKVIFSQASVILSTGGRAWLGETWVAGSACMARTPLADTTATAYGQWAGGTHPTRMHSCLFTICTTCLFTICISTHGIVSIYRYYWWPST